MTTEAQPKKKYSSHPDSSFEEVGRVQTSDTVTIVVSKRFQNKDLKGYSATKYIASEDFTGWAKGIYIPEEDLVEFLKLFPQEDLEEALISFRPKPQPVVVKKM